MGRRVRIDPKNIFVSYTVLNLLVKTNFEKMNGKKFTKYLEGKEKCSTFALAFGKELTKRKLNDF